jgi:uncharacterized protein (TIGR03000 family)
MGLRKVLFGVVVAVAAVTLAAQDASAFWGHGSWGSWGGSWGGGGSCGGSWGGGGSCGGSWGSGGSCGGLFRRWGGGSWGSGGSCGGSYGSTGSCGSCGGAAVSYGSCGSCGGEGVSYGGYGGEVVSGYASSNSAARFAPAGAYAASEVSAAKTKLTLHVPAEAKVTLAGVATKQAGEVREFSTSKLAAGQAWENYTVHVELVRDGKTLTQDKKITLTGGSAQELSIDFGAAELAQM